MVLAHRERGDRRLRRHPPVRPPHEPGPGRRGAERAPRPAGRAPRHGTDRRDPPLRRDALPPADEARRRGASAGGAGAAPRPEAARRSARTVHGGVPAARRVPGRARSRRLSRGRDRRRLPPRGGAGGAAAALARQRQPGVRSVPRAVRRGGAPGHALRRGGGGARRVLRDAAGLRSGPPEPDRHAARSGDRLAPLALRPARVHPAALGLSARRFPPAPAGHARRDPRGGARADDALPRLEPEPPVAGPRLPGTRDRVRALHPGPRLDAPCGDDREERPRVARSALPPARAPHHPAGPGPGRGAGSAPALGHHGALDHRPLGAEPGLPAHQAAVRESRRRGLRLLPGRLLRRPGPGRRRRLRGPARPRLEARHPPGERHGAEPHGDRFPLGDGASRLVRVTRFQPVLQLQLQRASSPSSASMPP